MAREAGLLPEHIAALLTPAIYPHTVERVELRQTHISWVLLAGDFAYKLKKPVDFGFLDYRTLEARHGFALDEVRLNRRLCPDIYLDVIALRRTPGGYALGEGEGGVVDWVVRMRRLPEERMLDRLLRAEAAPASMIEEIARTLAAFHAGAEHGPEVAALGSPEVLHAHWRQNIDQLQPYVGRTLSERELVDLALAVDRSEAALLELLRRRQMEGRGRDGHGDVRAENICMLEDGPRIFDCIEFNARMRCADVAADVAFLAMDLDWWGRHDLSEAYVNAYVAASGDEELRAILPFFQCYRAVVRAKVESVRLDDPGFDQAARDEATAKARRYLALALRYAGVRTTPVLLVVSGLSGTGKSTLARALGERLGWEHLSSDRIRKELAGFRPEQRPDARQRAWLYGAGMGRRTYDTMHAWAARRLREQRSVIVDATYLNDTERRTARRLAARHDATFLLVECTAPPEVVAARLAAREAENRDASDATLAIYEAQRERGGMRGTRLIVDTTEPLDDQVTRVLEALPEEVREPVLD